MQDLVCIIVSYTVKKNLSIMTKEHCLLYEGALTTYLRGRVQCFSGCCVFKEQHESNLRKNINDHEKMSSVAEKKR
jgi:hypothetical protein